MSEIDTSTEAIAALMDGVTPGPWCAGAHRWPEQVGCCPLVGRPFSAHRHLRNVAAANTKADIRFIAASRDLVPALAAENTTLREEVKRLRAALYNAEHLIAIAFNGALPRTRECKDVLDEIDNALKAAQK